MQSMMWAACPTSKPPEKSQNQYQLKNTLGSRSRGGALPNHCFQSSFPASGLAVMSLVLLSHQELTSLTSPSTPESIIFFSSWNNSELRRCVPT